MRDCTAADHHPWSVLELDHLVDLADARRQVVRHRDGQPENLGPVHATRFAKRREQHVSSEIDNVRGATPEGRK
jgi:hypothetical protein